MIRPLDILLIGAVVAGAVWTYQTKHEAELSAARIAETKRQIAAENERIRLLEADWAIATSPERMEKLAERFAEQLKLEPLQSHQIIDRQELPPLREEQPLDDDAYAGEIDRVTTGSIGDLIERERKR